MKDSPCILIVDDQQSEVMLTAEVLKDAGMSVTVVGDGFKALAACKVRAPDVILLDLQMPLMSGLEVLNRLSNEERTREIPVIFLRPEQMEVPSGPQYEEYAVAAKPLEPQDVLSLVKTVLREKALKDELRRKELQVKELTLNDPLTSLRNSRYLMEFLKTELSQCQRYKHPLSLLVMEIDSAKDLLKAHGQRGMDALVTQLSQVLNQANRRADLLARTSPAEFVLVLPFTPADGAVEVAERKRTMVMQTAFPHQGQEIPLTISIGICQFRPDMDVQGEMLLSFARAAMQQARDTGGNQTFMAE